MGRSREMRERIRFSVRPISASQTVLSMSLILVACASLYLGYMEHIDREGFSLPKPYVELFVDQIEKQIKPLEIEGGENLAIAELREQLR